MRGSKVINKLISYLVVTAVVITAMTGFEKTVQVQADGAAYESASDQYLVPVGISDSNPTPSFDAAGNVVFTTASLAGATEITSASAITLTGGTYYVEGSDVSVSSRITVSGDVILVLKSGSKLTANNGIAVTSDNSLTICAQTTDEAAMGELIAESYSVNCAAIGGDNSSKNGTIRIYGGHIKAETNTAAAAIGNGYDKPIGNGIYIYGGKIEAKANQNGAAAIGSGLCCSVDGIYIYGGNITAQTVNSDGAVIGCGATDSAHPNISATNINILGGKVVAQKPNSNGAVIGSGINASVGKINISGGTITALGGVSGSCIGACMGCTCEEITISGGNIKVNEEFTSPAYGSSTRSVRNYCCGIGNGAGANVSGQTTKITISGANTRVTAHAGGNGAPAIRLSNSGSDASGILEIASDVTSGNFNVTDNIEYSAVSADSTPRTRGIKLGGATNLSFTLGAASTQKAADLLGYSGFAGIPTPGLTIIKDGVDVTTSAGITATITSGEINVSTTTGTPAGTYTVVISASTAADGDSASADVCSVVVAAAQSNTPYYYPIYIPVEETETAVTPESEGAKEEEKKEIEKKTVEQVPEKLAKKITDKLSDAFGSKKIEVTYSSPAEAQTATRKGKTYYDENGDPVQNSFIKLKSGEIRYTNDKGKYVKKAFIAVIDAETNKIDTYYVGKSSYLFIDKTFTKKGEKYTADSEGKIEGKSYKIKSNGKIKLDTDKKK